MMWLRKAWFTWSEEENFLGDYTAFAFFLGMLAALLTVGVVGLTYWSIPIAVALYLTAASSPFWGRLHPAGGYGEGKDEQIAKRYYNLPKAQRSEIPATAVKTLKNKHLSSGQRSVLRSNLLEAVKEAESCRDQILQLEAQAKVKHIDIADVLHEVEAAKQRLKSDKNTYKEFIS